MSRIARAVLEGIPHHVTQRGNGRQVVFDTLQSRQLYLNLLRIYSERFGLRISAYCLMPNHVHVVAVPAKADSLARALGRTHADYARYLNVCRTSCGHVWQARYFSCPLGDQHHWNAMAYVERNPVRAGLCAAAANYSWSSAQAHVYGRDEDGFLDLDAWRQRYDGSSWKRILDLPSEDEAFRQRLQEATLRGRPFCEPDTLDKFEKSLGRRLRPQPSGRPRKGRDTTVDQVGWGVGLANGE